MDIWLKYSLVEQLKRQLRSMIKFFRHIRKDLMEKNKTGKYLKYAIGEIILVVIGILIALGVSSWNTTRLEKNTITNYYNRIIVELDQETANAKMQKIKLEGLINKNKRALKIIDSRNMDSLNTLKKLLGSTATTWGINYNFPITKEFVNQNYLSKIENDTLKINIEQLAWFFDFSERNRDYNTTQYVNTIEPFFIKHINYSEVALPMYREGLVQGGPKTNYEALFTNLELWNVITFKLEGLNNEYNTLKRVTKNFGFIKEILLKELER